jgi:hypothetical protein
VLDLNNLRACQATYDCFEFGTASRGLAAILPIRPLAQLSATWYSKTTLIEQRGCCWWSLLLSLLLLLHKEPLLQQQKVKECLSPEI